MGKPAKRSVSVLVRNGNHILAVRRADDDNELPGVWGLPAGTFQPDESLQTLVARIGKQKLGVTLTPVRKLAEGTQNRPTYVLQMELWEAAMEGIPIHPAYHWSDMEILKPGRDRGSLCCELVLGIDWA